MPCSDGNPARNFVLSPHFSTIAIGSASCPCRDMHSAFLEAVTLFRHVMARPLRRPVSFTHLPGTNAQAGRPSHHVNTSPAPVWRSLCRQICSYPWPNFRLRGTFPASYARSLMYDRRQGRTPCSLRRLQSQVQFTTSQNHIRNPATSWKTLVFSPAALRKLAVSPKLFSHETPT